MESQHRHFLDRFNQFLTLEGEPPLMVAPDARLPADFSQRVADAFDQMHLNQHDNAFNAARKQATRESERTRNACMADFYEAIATLLEAEHAPYTIVGNSIAMDAVDAADHRSRLWKRVVHREAGGELRATLEPVDHIDFSRRPVICFGGNNGNNLSHPSLMHTMKNAEQALGGFDIYNEDSGCDDIDIYIIGHPACHRARSNTESFRFNANPEGYSVSWVRESFSRYFKPFIEDAIAKDSAHTLAPLKAAARKLNFFSNSFGSCCIKSVRNEMAALLHERGYSNAEIKEVFTEVCAVMVDASALLDYTPPEGNFSAVYVLSRNDRFVRARSDYQRFVDPDTLTRFPAIRPLPHSDNELLVIVDAPVRGVVWNPVEMARDQEAGKPPRAAEIQPRGWVATDRSGHNLSLSNSRIAEISDEPIVRYSSPDLTEYALRNALQRPDHLGDVASLLTKTQLTPPRHPLGTGRFIHASHAETEAIRRQAGNDNGKGA